ncbi:hypothetical protein SEA_KARDASHIAN_40 [Streptomyces phage Kardashian]|nr:hypothetical protein SEA_KARDASHIAN_40 [Streptomyces phage Kardashian]
MQIKIARPHPDYPLAYVHVSPNTNLDRPDLVEILENNRLTILGRWEPHMVGTSMDSFKAPVLLEDEHVKPRKKAAAKPQTRKVTKAQIKK